MFKYMAVVWALILLGLSLSGQAAENGLVFTHFQWTAHADRGLMTLTYHLTPANRSADVGVQIFAYSSDPKQGKRYGRIVPTGDSGPLVISLFKGIDNTGKVTVALPEGTYGTCRILLYRSSDGQSVNFKELLYDSLADTQNPVIDLAVTVAGKHLTAPILVFDRDVDTRNDGTGNFTVILSASVHLPRHYAIPGNGFWAMAKGAAGFSQVWVGLNKAVVGGDPYDDYDKIPVAFTLKHVKPGLGNVQFGLYNANFHDRICWLNPGLDYEVGEDTWIDRAPAASVPPRLRVHRGRFETISGTPYDFYVDHPNGKKAVAFVRGGNYGNALSRSIFPALNKPGYFVLLREMGCRFLRFDFNPDRFLAERPYQHAVEQVVENMWIAGVYPILAPQDLPIGNTVEERIEKGERLCQLMATKFKDKSVWIEVCNEPHEFLTWEAWKPVALRYAKTIRAIDPAAFVIVPFENYSKDGRGAARAPITEVAVDLYDGHAYVDPKAVVTLFGPAIKAGLPVLIGEYGGGAEYLARMDAELQKLPGLLASGPWAFTIQGEDKLPLIQSGATAELKFTPAGQVIAEDYALWNAGKRRAP